MRKILRIFIIVLLAGVLVFSVFMIIKTMWEYSEADNIYESLQNEFVEVKPDDSANADDSKSNTEPVETAPISVDFASLQEQNSDIVGWLYCPDTPVNYPVVQGKDNNQYLRADLNRKYLVSGTVFTDYRNRAVGEDANYIVYGHKMKNGTMFGSLVKYKEQSYYDEHSVLYYLTPDDDYKVELCVGLVVKRDSVIYSPNPEEMEFAEFLTYAKKHSTFQSDVEITEDDTLITLSTCSYEYNDARYIVIGKAEKI